MEGLFSYCSSLKSIPDIVKWNINKNLNIKGMLSYCNSLISFPDIAQWDVFYGINNDVLVEGKAIMFDTLDIIPDVNA